MQDLKSLSLIFKERLFKIPDYQRGYAWQSPQLEDFWEDLLNLRDGHKHYTGMLTIQKVTNNSPEWSKWQQEQWLVEKNCEPYFIVDGQQRLTTVIILVKEIINYFSNLEENIGKTPEEIIIGDAYRLSEVIETYIVRQHPLDGSRRTYLFSYEVDNPSSKYMRSRIMEDDLVASVDETVYTNNLQNAKQFFRDKLSILSSAQVLTAFKNLTQNLKFNEYIISDDFDIFVAFETMNNRGKKLSYLELLKNRLIYLTTLFSDSIAPESLKAELRKDINDAWKDIYGELGRSRNSKLDDDDFLREHWILYFGYNRKRGSAFNHFLLGQYFTPKMVFDGKITPEIITGYIKSLQKTVSIWCASSAPLEDDRIFSRNEQILIDKINRVGVAYFRPLIVATYLQSDVAREQREQLLKQIEQFIFIAFRVSRYLTTYGNSTYYNFANKLYRKIEDTTIRDVSDSLRDDLDMVDENGELNEIPFREFLARNFRNHEGYYSWNDLHYLLFEYEEYLRGNNDRPEINWRDFTEGSKGKVTIEHIFPQTPWRDDGNDSEDGKYWRKFFGKYDDKQRKYLTGSLGNLVGLPWYKNSELQNVAFPKKARDFIGKDGKDESYSNGSRSTKEISDLQDWTPQEIKERGLHLLSFMEKRWGFKFKDKESLLFLDFIKDKNKE